jgi:hypothetical protein
MFVILGLAVYLSAVTLPARRERFARAERQIRERVSLLLRAADEDRTTKRKLRTQYEKDVACAEAEDTEAAKHPAGSDEAQSHRVIAGLWRQAARRVPLSSADEAGHRATAIEAWVATLGKSRSEAEGSLARFEAVARAVRDWPTSKEWVRLGIADRLATLESEIRAERRDATTRAIAESDPGP